MYFAHLSGQTDNRNVISICCIAFNSLHAKQPVAYFGLCHWVIFRDLLCVYYVSGNKRLYHIYTQFFVIILFLLQVDGKLSTIIWLYVILLKKNAFISWSISTCMNYLRNTIQWINWYRLLVSIIHHTITVFTIVSHSVCVLSCVSLGNNLPWSQPRCGSVQNTGVDTKAHHT